MLKPAALVLFCLSSLMGSSQTKTDKVLTELFKRNKNRIFQQIIQNPDEFRLQVIYTQIDRDKNNRPMFTNHYFHYDPNLYFNPASMVKMPLAFLALEKLNRMDIDGVDKKTTVLFDTAQRWQRPLHQDTTSASGLPSIAHFIKRAFLVSENDPYNRLYQFLGQGYINDELHKKGYNDVRITRQFLGLTSEQNRHTNPLRFVDGNGKLLFAQHAAYNNKPFSFPDPILLGHAHIRRDSMVEAPFDFTEHNNLSLETMQQLLQSVMFPQSVPADRRFELTEDDYSFLYRYLSQYPSETPDPKYDTTEFYDSYVKFFFRDSTHRMPEGLRVFNKVGWSYGFLTDVSYVADFNNKVEYMLAATLYVNSDGVLNDNKYEYTTMGWPFLYQLGQTIYQHELKRKKKFVPDLSAFRIRYEHRQAGDRRPVLKEVDND